jgi:phage portal protein BeeE
VFRKIRETIRAGIKSVTVDGDTGWTVVNGGFAPNGFLPASKLDFGKEAGQLWKNSIVLACIKWQGRVMPEAPAVVQRKGAKGKWEIVPEHPFALLLDTPNGWYDGTTLLQALLLSLAVDGNGYYYKLRSRAGLLAGYQYVPHMRITPFHQDGDPNPLSGYRIQSKGGFRDLAPDSVCHFRDGYDPERELRGLSSLGAVLREVCTDNEGLTFAYSLLKQMGFPGAIISPKGGPEVQLSPIQINTFRRLWEENFTGDGRGKPFIQGLPVDVAMPAYSPRDMAMEQVHDIPEERITAALGIPAVVVGLGAGLAAAGDRNLEAMESWAWRHNVIPTQRILSCHLTRDAQSEGLLRPDERVAFDNSEVAALQEDRDKQFNRLTEAVGGPWLSANEARLEIGREKIDGGDKLYPPKALPTPKPGDAAGKAAIAERWRSKRSW